MAARTVERIVPAFQGLNTEASPDYVPKNQAPVLANYLVNQPGKLKMRGPLSQYMVVAPDNPNRTYGLWTLGERVLINTNGVDSHYLGTDVSIAAQDGFDFGVTDAVLHGRVAPSGGTWATSGVTGDFLLGPRYGSEVVKREGVSEASPRRAILGTTNYAAVAGEVTIYCDGFVGSSNSVMQALLLRYVDANNYLMASFEVSHVSGFPRPIIHLTQYVAGAPTTLGYYDYTMGLTAALGQYYSIRASVDTTGYATMSLWTAGTSSTLVGNVMGVLPSAALASGGALATGKVGIQDQKLGTSPAMRIYDNVQVTGSSGSGLSLPAQVVTANAALCPSDVYAQIGGHSYGPAYGGSPKPLLKWSGSGAPVAQANAPTDAIDVANFLERLIVLGGGQPGGPTTQRNDMLWWTDVGGPDTGTLADWQDDVSGLTNQLTLPADGMGLARVTNALIIFHRSKVSMLQGSSPSNWSVRPALSNRGLIHRRAVLELGDAVLFVSDSGLYSFDGVSESLLSADVNSELLRALAGVTGSTVQPTLAYLPGGYVQLTVSLLGVSGESVLFSKLLHLASGAWVDLSTHTDIMARGMLYPANTDKLSLIWDAKRLWVTNALTSPPTLTGWDSVSATRRAIPASWHTRLASLAMPHRLARLKRLLADYSFVTSSSDSTSPTIRLVSGEEDELLPATLLPSVVDPAPYLHRARFKQDVYGETTDVQVQVEWNPSDGTADLTQAELYDVTIEYDAAQQT